MVLLSAANRLLRTSASSDGSFSFRDVVAGDYQLRMPIGQFAWGSRPILVEDRDLTGIDLVPDESLPVMGRVVTEGRGPVPSFSFSLEGPKGSTRGSDIWVSDTVRSSGMVGVSGWSDRPDDVIFNASLPIGEYRIALTGLPAGYQVKSFSYGETDLRERPLRLTGVVRQLSIVLSSPESSRFARISGRLVRDEILPPQMASERVLLQGPLLAPLEAAIEKDGSFELSGVPPGVYWMNSPALGLRLVIGSGDVRGVELRNSRIRARYEHFVRAAANPPLHRATTATDESVDPPARREPAGSVALEPVKRVTVSGRVTGSTSSEILNALRVVLTGDAFSTAITPDAAGGFVFPEVSSGTYTLAINSNGLSYAEPSNTRTVVVQDADIEDIDLPAPPLKKTVRGRIVVEGGFPLPLMALTVRPNLDAGPPFAHPYTLRSADEAFVLHGDGRFVVELPEGAHRLRVDGYPDTAYRLRSVTYGSANLRKDLLQIDGENPKELVITFSAAPASYWPKVKGRVAGLANVAEPVRVVLLSTRTRLRLDAVPRRDGTFEFSKVPPDTYTVLTAPRVAAMVRKTIVVAGREVSQVDLVFPAQKNLTVRITADEGRPPAPSSLTLTLSKTEAYNVLLPVPIVYRTAHEMRCISDVCSSSSEKMLGAPTIMPSSRSDGTVVLRLPEGEYRAELQGIPPGYAIRSFTSGSVNLLDAPLRVGPATPEDITVTLSRR
jgi:hypothetical protein